MLFTNTLFPHTAFSHTPGVGKVPCVDLIQPKSPHFHPQRPGFTGDHNNPTRVGLLFPQHFSVLQGGAQKRGAKVSIKCRLTQSPWNHIQNTRKPGGVIRHGAAGDLVGFFESSPAKTGRCGSIPGNYPTRKIEKNASECRLIHAARALLRSRPLPNACAME